MTSQDTGLSAKAPAGPPAPVALMAGITMLAFAANSALCRAALLAPEPIDPTLFTLLRLGSGALALTVLLVLRPGPQGVTSADASSARRSWVPALTLTAYALGFSGAYTRLDTGTGALLLFGAVQFTMFAHAALAPGASRPPPRAWLGMGIALVALAYMLAPSETSPDLLAAGAMTGAGVAWGAYTLMGRVPLHAAAVRNPTREIRRAFVGATLLVAAVVAGLAVTGAVLVPQPITMGSEGAQGIIYALSSGVFASAMGYVLWYATLPHLRATTAAVIQLSVPVIAALAGALWLAELPGPRVITAAPLVLLGIALVVTARPASGKAPS